MMSEACGAVSVVRPAMNLHLDAASENSSQVLQCCPSEMVIRAVATTLQRSGDEAAPAQWGWAWLRVHPGAPIYVRAYIRVKCSVDVDVKGLMSRIQIKCMGTRDARVCGALAVPTRSERETPHAARRPSIMTSVEARTCWGPLKALLSRIMKKAHSVQCSSDDSSRGVYVGDPWYSVGARMKFSYSPQAP